MSRDPHAALRAELHADWRDKAACQGQGVLMDDPTREDEAKRLCWSCPVRSDCLALILRLPQSDDPKGEVIAALTWEQRRSRRLSAAYYKRLEASQ